MLGARGARLHALAGEAGEPRPPRGGAGPEAGVRRSGEAGRFAMYLDILARILETGVRVAIENQLDRDRPRPSRSVAHLRHRPGKRASPSGWRPRSTTSTRRRCTSSTSGPATTSASTASRSRWRPQCRAASPRPRFRTVVRPGEWHRGPHAGAGGEVRDVWQQHDDFFRPLIAESEHGLRFAARSRRPSTSTTPAAGPSPPGLGDGIGYAVSFWKNGPRGLPSTSEMGGQRSRSNACVRRVLLADRGGSSSSIDPLGSRFTMMACSAG